MGTKCCIAKCNEESKNNDENIISKIHFIRKYPIGKGGFGKVNKKYNFNCFNNIIGLESSI